MLLSATILASPLECISVGGTTRVNFMPVAIMSRYPAYFPVRTFNVSCSNMTTHDRVDLNRYSICPRIALSYWAWSPPKSHISKLLTICDDESRRRLAMFRWSVSPSVHNVASHPQWKGTAFRLRTSVTN